MCTIYVGGTTMFKKKETINLGARVRDTSRREEVRENSWYLDEWMNESRHHGSTGKSICFSAWLWCLGPI